MMGINLSSYNVDKTNLVVEQVAQGNRHDTSLIPGEENSNPFQWATLVLNFNWITTYKPNERLTSKQRKYGTLESF